MVMFESSDNSSIYEMKNETEPTANWTFHTTTKDEHPWNATVDESVVNITVPPVFMLRDNVWVIPLVTLSTINISAIIFFEVYVLYKSCGSRRHLFLGQVLLLGLFVASLLGYAFVPRPHWVTCTVIRAGVGLAYVTIFSTLLVKLVFLMSLHAGTYLTTCYQALLLFFAIAAQVPITVQWLVFRPPGVLPEEEDTTVAKYCATYPVERIQYLSYAMFLLFLLIVSSLRARTFKENNKEALYIAVAVGIILPIWVAWTALILIFGRRYEHAAEGIGLVCTASVVFLLIFVPKAVQLSSISLRKKNSSTTGSHSVVYTPSFLHLQPHAVLPGSNEGTLIKHKPNLVKDNFPNHPLRFLRYDYATFHQREPLSFHTSDRISDKKPDLTFVHTPLY